MEPEEEVKIIIEALSSLLNEEKLPCSYPGIKIQETMGYEAINCLCDYAKG